MSTFADEKHVDAMEKQHEHSPSSFSDHEDGKVDWSFRQVMATVFLSMLWVGSQMPLYFMGGCLSYVAMDIGGTAASSWLPVCNTLVLAAVCPFCGYLQDLFGRRNITLAGGAVLMIGLIVVATAHSFGAGIVGMCLAGAGAGIGELTALAGTSELVPVRKRGYYIAIIVLFLLPITPYVLYTQLLATRSTWRWAFWICLIYNGIALSGIAIFYFPERYHAVSRGAKMEIVKRIDYVGGILSIAGITLFLVAIQSGGYTHPWTAAEVLAPLIIGILLVIGFVIWEWRFAKEPIIPHGLFKGRKAMGISFVVAFVGGMNFYSLINFYPLSFATLYSPDPVQVGLKGLGYGISVTAGAAFFNVLLSVFKGNNREILLTAAIVMTAFSAALVTVTPETPKMTVALGTIAGFGVGGILVPCQTIAVTVAPDELIATAVALSLAIRVIGGSIGYAIYYNIFANKIMVKLPELIVAYAAQAGLALSNAEEFVIAFTSDPTGATAMALPYVTPEILQAATEGSRWAYADSLKYVWYTSIAFGIIACIACLFLGNLRKFLTDRVAAHIKH